MQVVNREPLRKRCMRSLSCGAECGRLQTERCESDPEPGPL